MNPPAAAGGEETGAAGGGCRGAEGGGEAAGAAGVPEEPGLAAAEESLEEKLRNLTFRKQVSYRRIIGVDGRMEDFHTGPPLSSPCYTSHSLLKLNCCHYFCKLWF